MRRAAAVVALALAVLAGGPARAADALERVVLVVRHGVRSPTQSLEALQAATGRPWPAWPVAPGELTPHGELALSRMGDWLRGVYVGEGALPAAGCPAPGALQVWADGGDSRTRRSGEILAQALAPGCGVASRHGPDGETDPLFDAAQGVCPIDPAEAAKAVQARADAEGGLVRPPEARALQALQTILGPGACAAPAACPTAPTTLAASRKGVKLEGGLGAGATPAENLLLEYAQGFPAAQVGWGAAGSAATIAAVMPAHERAADLLRRTPYLDARNGAVLARTVAELLDGRDASGPHAPPLAGAARVTVIAGHDTNLSNLAGVFGLDWVFPAEPDSTAPGAALAFEVWRDGAGGRTVRVKVYAQSLEQLRQASALDAAHPPQTATPALGACGASSCAPAALAAAVLARIPKDCGGSG